jgi:C4-dicarboxylate transporter DctM subunit
LTVPILFPIAISLGIDPVWFGIYIIIVAEIDLITPPLGLNVYIIKTVAQDVPLEKSFWDAYLLSWACLDLFR